MPFFKHEAYNIPRSKRMENSAHKNGLRHAIFKINGDKYVGEWKQSTRNGKGVLHVVKPGKLYEGDFDNDQPDGFGVLAKRVPNRNVFCLVYRGDWKNGKMHGIGLKVFKDGSFYYGSWKIGKRHGYGEMWYADKMYFAGNWVNGVREGAGFLIGPDGNRFEGTFKNDLKHGRGKFYFMNSGQLQEGVWYMDNCTFSTICNFKYRQAVRAPTKYPLPKLTLVDAASLCATQEAKALLGQVECFIVERQERKEMHRDRMSSVISDASKSRKFEANISFIDSKKTTY